MYQRAQVHGRRLCSGLIGVCLLLLFAIRELSHSLLNLAERDGRASYPQFTAWREVPT